VTDSSSGLERTVLDHLDEDALVESLVELVRIPSVGGTDAEVDVQERVAGMLRELDVDVDRWDVDLDELTNDPWFPGVEVERR
jgi:acetylornithine deacetylase